jgi:hypothetical protein
MLFWGNERRRRRRYAVDWDGVLEVRFPDLREEQTVKLADLSSLGARFFVPRVYFRGRYLFSETRTARRMLRVFGPGASFESPISVRWYCWSVDRAAFETAVEFVRVRPESRKHLDRILSELRRRDGGVRIPLPFPDGGF